MMKIATGTSIIINAAAAIGPDRTKPPDKIWLNA